MNRGLSLASSLNRFLQWTRLSRQNFFLIIGTLIAFGLYTNLWITAQVRFDGRLLGWDTLVYAFSAIETQSQGIAWLNQDWGHPNAYVILLAAVSPLLGGVPSTANFLPVIMIGLLALGAGYLGRKLGNNAIGLLAAVLTATSFASFRLFVDLHRALLALVAVTFLIALNPPKIFSRIRLRAAGIVGVSLAFLAAFSEFEIYLALLVALVFRFVMIRMDVRSVSLTLMWASVPAAAFALTSSGSATLFGLAGGSPINVIEPLPMDLAFLYVLTLATLPFAVLGFVRLVEKARAEPQGVHSFFLSWVVILLLIFLVFGLLLQRISLFRPLILLPLPVLASVGADRAVRAWLSRTNKDTALLDEMSPLHGPSRNKGYVAFAILGASLILITGFQLSQNADRFLKPVVDDELQLRLMRSSEFIDEEWPAPIYLVTNKTYLQILPPIRLELGILQGPTFLYYGDINFIPWNVAPHSSDPSVRRPTSTFLTVDQEYRRILRILKPGPLGTLAHPIVMIQPELFSRNLQGSFEEFRVEEGLYVIPPHTLTLESFLRWEIFAEDDSMGLNGAYPVERDWSLSPRVVEIYRTSGGYQASYRHYFPISGKYTLAVHLFDFPATDFNSSTLLSPLQLLIGGLVVDTLTYGTSQVIWWNVTVQLDAGLRDITLRSESSDLPFRMSLDQIVVVAESS